MPLISDGIAALHQLAIVVGQCFIRKISEAKRADAVAGPASTAGMGLMMRFVDQDNAAVDGQFCHDVGSTAGCHSTAVGSATSIVLRLLSGKSRMASL